MFSPNLYSQVGVAQPAIEPHNNLFSNLFFLNFPFTNKHGLMFVSLCMQIVAMAPYIMSTFKVG